MKIDYNNFGLEIKKKRKEHNLSQAELAEKINKSTQHISKMERGLAKASLQTIVDVANALDVGIDELLCRSVRKGAKENINNEFEDIFKDCTLEEQRFLLESLKFSKYKLNEYTKSLNDKVY